MTFSHGRALVQACCWVSCKSNEGAETAPWDRRAPARLLSSVFLPWQFSRVALPYPHVDGARRAELELAVQVGLGGWIALEK